MVAGIKILLVLFMLGFMIWPFVFKKEDGGAQEEGAAGKKLHKLLAQKESAYAAIKELEFDYNMGKLSDEDYRELKEEYKRKAVLLLERIDELTGSGKVEDARG